jgi:leukotriene-A4 hydrolase
MEIRMMRRIATSLLLCSLAVAQTETHTFQHPPRKVERSATPVAVKDPHSFGNPEQVRVVTVDLDLTVNFEKKMLEGSAVLTYQRTPGTDGNVPMIVDTEKLDVKKVEAAGIDGRFVPIKYEFGPTDKILGTPLKIYIPGAAQQLKVTYSTSPDASALQWLTPEQTAGTQHPYLFTQNEDAHARSWIPLQDSPSVRITYEATIHAHDGLVAVMSASGNPQPAAGADPKGGEREFHFEMKRPIPSYLVALAVGDIAFRSTGPRTGVYSEPSEVEKAAKELEDVAKMVDATERLYGPYAWARYDVLILPPSFPYGGMENPKLTFATPTIIAGDKSLVSVITHELAHSWSGNTVTNATWSDFWLNEGITTYIERRIVEEVFGKKQAQMEWVLGRRTLDQQLKELPKEDTELHIPLAGRDPDEGQSELPYEKGSLFMYDLEHKFGRETFDAFLKSYFAHFRFQSITTMQFEDYLRANLLDKNAKIAATIPVNDWLYEPGLPKDAPQPTSPAFATVDTQRKQWLAGKLATAKLDGDWSTDEWLWFLRGLPDKLPRE